MIPAHRLMHHPCELGNFPVLLMEAGTLGNSRQQDGTAGWHPDPALSHIKMYRRSADNSAVSSSGPGLPPMVSLPSKGC